MSGEDRGLTLEPQRRWRRKIVLIIAVALAVVALLLAFLCHFTGIHSARDIVAYRAMAREHYHPVCKDLALGRIRKGDDVEKLLQRHSPSHLERFGIYANLSYSPHGSFNTLTIVAKNSRLILARAGSCTWRHTFFNTPQEETAFACARREYREQMQLEEDAYKIHRAIALGQDVFLSDHVERREVPDTSPSAKEMMAQLKAIYGDRYIHSVAMTQGELTVEIKDVLYGDLEPGAILKFPGDECDKADLDDPETVFLHFEDGGTMFEHAQGEPLYITVPKRALDWYESLTDDQIKAFEARRQQDQR